MIEKSFYLSICPLAIIIEVSAPLLNWYCSCLNSGFLEILHEAATPTTIGVGRKEQAWAGAPGGVWGQQCPRAELPEQEGQLLLEHVLHSNPTSMARRFANCHICSTAGRCLPYAAINIAAECITGSFIVFHCYLFATDITTASDVCWC